MLILTIQDHVGIHLFPKNVLGISDVN